MKYPDHNLETHPQTILLDAMFDSLAESEPRQRSAARATDSIQARMLGKACSTALTNPDYSNRWARAAEDFTALPASLSREQTNRVNGQTFYGELIKNKNDPIEVERIKKRQYATTISALEESLRLAEGQRTAQQRRRPVGETNELTALAIFNRKMNPGILALPALYHYDRNQQHRDNFDLALIVCPEGNETASFNRIQVKSTLEHISDHEYARNIYLLSSEEWFGYEQKFGLPRFPLARLLIQEFEDKAHPREIVVLDLITDGLLLDIRNQKLSKQTKSRKRNLVKQ